MAISELQLGLMGAGSLLVVSIFAFNKWQERKHRRQAESAAAALAQSASGSGERIEPGLDETHDVAPAQPTPRPVVDGGSRRVPPPLPADIDERADCVVRVESIEPVQSGRLLQAARKQLEGIAKPVRWFGFSDAENRWQLLDAHAGHSFHWLCAALQLVDRRGPASEGEVAAFCGGMQRICDVFMGIPTMPVKLEAMHKAAQLDRFCAGVDVQIGVNVIARQHAMAGTKLRGLAESAGLVLAGDGCFHACDEAGASLFVLGNQEAMLFAADEMRRLTTQGVTLTLDVPRVSDGVQVFDRMMALAQHLAESLDAVVVDDNRTPFGDKAVGLIRAQIGQYQTRMLEHGLAPGSALAQRLFA